MLRLLFYPFLFISLAGLSQSSPKLINRNTKAPIDVNGVIIRQDKRNIGFVKLLEEYNNGKPTNVYQVFLPNGTQVATAFSFGKESHQWMVTILSKPEITFDVTAKQGQDIKEIAAALVRNGYL